MYDYWNYSYGFSQFVSVHLLNNNLEVNKYFLHSFILLIHNKNVT